MRLVPWLQLSTVVGCSRGCVGVSSGWDVRRGSEVGRFSRRRVPRGSGRLLVGHAARRGDDGRMVGVPFQLGRSTRWTRRRRWVLKSKESVEGGETRWKKKTE